MTENYQHGNFHFLENEDVAIFSKKGSFSLTFHGLNRLHVLITTVKDMKRRTSEMAVERYAALEQELQAVIDKHTRKLVQEKKEMYEGISSLYGERTQNYTLVDWIEMQETGEEWNPNKYPMKGQEHIPLYQSKRKRE